MKASIFLFLAVVITMVSCVKKGIDTNKIITATKNSLQGRWKAEFSATGATRVRTYYPPGQVLEFDFSHQDSARYFVNDTVKSRAFITFAINDTYASPALITTLDMPGILPKVGVEGIVNDTLGLFVLEANAISYYFSRVH